MPVSRPRESILTSDSRYGPLAGLSYMYYESSKSTAGQLSQQANGSIGRTAADWGHQESTCGPHLLRLVQPRQQAGRSVKAAARSRKQQRIKGLLETLDLERIDASSTASCENRPFGGSNSASVHFGGSISASVHFGGSAGYDAPVFPKFHMILGRLRRLLPGPKLDSVQITSPSLF
jgi:hypothetical protein